MKHLFAILSASSLMFSVLSCDKVNDPIVKKEQPPIDTSTKNQPAVLVKNSNASVAGFKKFLLEDYTGQTCPNCPAAARTITSSLIPRYGDTMVVIAVHQGNTFAKPSVTFTNDFRTTEGEIWGGTQGYNIPYWPCGLINRTTYGATTSNPQTAWTSIAPIASKEPFILQLNLSTEYDTVSRKLNLEVKSKFRKDYANDVNVVAVYLQDGIVGKQKDGSKEIEEYEFEHMMRGSINDTWGTVLKTGPSAVLDSTTVKFSNFFLPRTAGLTDAGKTPVISGKVSIVVFAYDAKTRVVLQAEKVKLIP